MLIPFKYIYNCSCWPRLFKTQRFFTPNDARFSIFHNAMTIKRLQNSMENRI